eukprot:10115916-Alexandrium_andersonii.AAC.1
MADALLGKDGLLNDNFSVGPACLSEADQLKFFQELSKTEGGNAKIKKKRKSKELADQIWRR